VFTRLDPVLPINSLPASDQIQVIFGPTFPSLKIAFGDSHIPAALTPAFIKGTCLSSYDEDISIESKHIQKNLTLVISCSIVSADGSSPE
jgi:hypothetical protein